MTELNDSSVRRLARILAKQAEVESMKADNAQREVEGNSPAYTGKAFADIARELETLAYAHDDQLGI